MPAPMTESGLIVPTLNLNGSSRADLRNPLMEALGGLQCVLTQLRETGPNGRDYHFHGPEALRQAQAEHLARVKAVHDVQQQVYDLIEAIDAQGGGR